MTTLAQEGITCPWCAPEADEASCVGMNPGKPGRIEKYAPTCGRLVHAHTMRLAILGQLRGWFADPALQVRATGDAIDHAIRFRMLIGLRGWRRYP